MEGRVEEEARQNARIDARLEAAVLRVRARRQEERDAEIMAERSKTERMEELRVRLRRLHEERKNERNNDNERNNGPNVAAFEVALWLLVRWMFMTIYTGIVMVVTTFLYAVPVVLRFMCDLFRLVCSLVCHLVAMLNPPPTPAPATPSPCAICHASKEISGSPLSVCCGCGKNFHTHCIDQMKQHGHSACPLCRSTQGFVPLRW